MNSNLREILLPNLTVIDKESEDGVKKKKKLFVLNYWVEEIKYNGEIKERYKFLKENSEVKNILDNIFKEYEIDKNYISFRNLKMKKEKNNKEEIVEVERKYIGLNKI
jgi:hypothetical protein